MGADKIMDGGKKKTNPRLEQLKCQTTKSQQNPAITHHSEPPHSPNSPCQEGPHLLACGSSPSLLTGCGDSTTPAGACIERHMHSHHVHTNSPAFSPQVQEESTQIYFPSSPLASPTSEDVPDYVFLTPSPPRARNSRHERPSSAPPHHLESISASLLRLVGDHYLCCTCGRQLRTIGDQLTLETNLRHALSSSDLNRFQNR